MGALAARWYSGGHNIISMPFYKDHGPPTAVTWHMIHIFGHQPTGTIVKIGSFPLDRYMSRAFGWAYSFALKALQVIIARNANTWGSDILIIGCAPKNQCSGILPSISIDIIFSLIFIIQ